MVTAAYGFIDISSVPLSFGGLNELTFPPFTLIETSKEGKNQLTMCGMFPGISVEEGEGPEGRMHGRGQATSLLSHKLWRRFAAQGVPNKYI